LCIDSAGNRIICSNYAERFGGDLPIFPLHQNIVARSFVTRVVGLEWSFMGNNASKFPYNIGIFIPLNMSQDVIVAHYLLNSIIIDGAQEFEVLRMVHELILMGFNGLDNPCMEALSILLWF